MSGARKTDTPLDRLMRQAQPEPNTGCWLWEGHLSAGYGYLRVHGAAHKAHRLSYELHRGPIPPGMFVCHKCDVRICCNPDHLFVGTHADNMADMALKGRAARQGGPKGDAAYFSKLSPEQVAEILTSPESSRTIAARLSVTSGLVRRIRRRQAWKHISIPTQPVGPGCSGSAS